MTINKRMQLVVNNLFNGNKAAFSKCIGVNPTTISNIIGRDRATKPSSEILENIAVNLPNVNIRWLLTGEGEMLPNNAPHGYTASASNSMVAGNIAVIDYSNSTIYPEELQEAHRRIALLEAKLEQIDKLLAEKDNVIGEKERLIQILLKE